MAEKTFQAVINQNPFYMAKVEIIIPFHDETTRVSKLIEGIFNTVRTNRYLITLVDDCSKNRNFIKIINERKLPGVRCLRQEEHKGFGAAINLALSKPWGKNKPIDIPYVLIMHSDVIVSNPNWLFNLGNSLRGNVKMVSAMDKKDGKTEEEFSSMYCSLATRELFNTVGKFAEYPYAGVEVEDYALRMKKLGFKQTICKDSWVEHFGSGTLSNFKDNLKAQKLLLEIKEKFEKDNI